MQKNQKHNVIYTAAIVLTVCVNGLFGNENKITEENNLYTYLPNCEIIKLAQERNLEKIEYALKKGIEVNCQNKFGKTALMIAAAHNPDAIPLLMAYGADVNLVDRNGNTALVEAQGQSNISAMKYLIDAKADLEKRDKHMGHTVLMKACSARGQKEIVRLLLESGANPNAKDISGTTPLMIDVQFGGNYIDLLMEKGANINEIDENGRTALAFAAEYGSPETIKSVLSYKPDLTIKGKSGQSVIFYAVQNNNPDVIGLFVEAGAEINTLDKQGRNVLLDAAYHKKNDTVRKLVESGLSINSVDNTGRPFLSLMAKCGLEYAWHLQDYVKMVNLFLGLGADINLKDNAGMTPLMHAAMKGNDKAFEVLVDAGADTSVKDLQGRSYIDYLNAAGAPESVERLIRVVEQKRMIGPDEIGKLREKNGEIKQIFEDNDNITVDVPVEITELEIVEDKSLALAETDIHSRDKDGRTLLIRLCEEGADAGLVKSVLDAGAEVNARDNDGRSALMVAASKCSADVINLLVNAGADIKAENNKNKNVFMYACQNQDPKIAAMFVSHFDINKKDLFGHNALGYAGWGSTETIKWLIDAGIEYNIDNLMEAFLGAIASDNTSTMQLLINAGADVTRRLDSSLKDTLNYAAIYATKKETVLFLADQISQKDSLDKYIFSALESGLFNYRNSYATQEVIDCYKELAAKTDTQRYRSVLTHNLASCSRSIDSPVFIQQLIDEGADPKGVDKFGWTVLMNAAQNSNPEIVKLILKYDPDVDRVFESQGIRYTALHYAVMHNANPEIIKVLIQAGADIQNKDIYGNLANVATGNRNSEIIDLLKSSGIYDNNNSGQLLADAACNANLEMVRQLIATGIEKESLSKALYNVSGNHCANVFKDGLDIKFEIIKELVNAGADVNARFDSMERTVLMNLLMSGSRVEAVKFVIENGADVNTKAHGNYTPLLAASAHGNKQIITVLISAGADLEAKDNMGNTPLLNAVRHNNMEGFDSLLSLGAIIDDSNSYELLSKSLLGVSGNKNEMFEKLLAAGVNINAVNKHGQTILMSLCEHTKDISLIQLVLDNGADIKIRDKRGYDAHYYLQRNPKLKNNKTSLPSE